MREANDLIRGIQGYFDLALENIRALRKKKVAFSVTLNGISAKELGELAEVAHGVGADLEFNILSRNLFFLKNGDIATMWPDRGNVEAIQKFLHDTISVQTTKSITSEGTTTTTPLKSLRACQVIFKFLCYRTATC